MGYWQAIVDNTYLYPVRAQISPEASDMEGGREHEEKVEQAVAILRTISEDFTTPRNIRRAAKQSIDALMDESLSPGVRAANAISILDEISQDPNMPLPTRTKIWQVISILEGIKD